MPPITDAAFRLLLDVRPLPDDAVLSVDVEGALRGRRFAFAGSWRGSRRAGAPRASAGGARRGGRGGGHAQPARFVTWRRPARRPAAFAWPLPAGPVTLRLAWTRPLLRRPARPLPGAARG